MSDGQSDQPPERVIGWRFPADQSIWSIIRDSFRIFGSHLFRLWTIAIGALGLSVSVLLLVTGKGYGFSRGNPYRTLEVAFQVLFVPLYCFLLVWPHLEYFKKRRTDPSRLATSKAQHFLALPALCVAMFVALFQFIFGLFPLPNIRDSAGSIYGVVMENGNPAANVKVETGLPALEFTALFARFPVKYPYLQPVASSGAFRLPTTYSLSMFLPIFFGDPIEEHSIHIIRDDLPPIEWSGRFGIGYPKAKIFVCELTDPPEPSKTKVQNIVCTGYGLDSGGGVASYGAAERNRSVSPAPPAAARPGLLQLAQQIDADGSEELKPVIAAVLAATPEP